MTPEEIDKICQDEKSQNDEVDLLSTAIGLGIITGIFAIIFTLIWLITR